VQVPATLPITDSPGILPPHGNRSGLPRAHPSGTSLHTPAKRPCYMTGMLIVE